VEGFLHWATYELGRLSSVQRATKGEGAPQFGQFREQKDLFLATAPKLLPPYTDLGDVEEIFNPLGVSLGASES
jgi:hypothetical protein